LNFLKNYFKKEIFMKKTILFFTIMLFTASLAFGLDYTIELSDSYGDGWNGGSIDVLVNSTVVLNDLTLSSGSGPESHSFTVVYDDVITTDYTAGSWSYENSYQIKDETSTVVAESGQGGATPGNVSYTVPNPSSPPSPATSPSPADDATGIAITTDLSWTAPGGTVTGYKVYFGTDNPPTNIENGTTQTGTTYDPSSDLSYSTQYYWKIVPYNANGDATGCVIWDFTTQDDPNYGQGTGTPLYYFANSLATGAPSYPSYSWYANQTGGANEGTLIADTDFVNGTEDDGHTDLMNIFGDASNFDFFGNTYSQMYLNTNGTIGFGVIGDAWHSYSFREIPSSSGSYHNMIAWCWDDLEYDSGISADVNIRISRLSDRTIVTYWQYPEYGGQDGYITAQVIIYKNGNIFIMYNDDESTYTQADNNCTIGIENSDGTAGIGYRYNQTGGPIFSSNLALAFGTDENNLPVVLSSFTAQFIGDLPVICWTTQSEDNNAGWNIYRGDYSDAFINGDVIQINPDLIEGAGTTAQPTDYIFEDQYEVIPGNEYWYILESVDYSGETFIYGSRSLVIPEEGSTPELPQLTLLKGNYPNPFNPATIIEFDIKENENARLSIYNMKGQLIETKIFEEGKHNYSWDATSFGSGVYFYKLESATYSEIRKMLMIK